MFDLSNVKLTEETVVRIMVYEIRERNPSAVSFIPDTNSIKMITSYLQERRFDKITYSFGMNFVMEILKLCEEGENYEMCTIIRNQISDLR
jgi:uncharacterized protein YukJ